MIALRQTFDPLDLDIIEQVYEAACAHVEAHNLYTSEDHNHGEEDTLEENDLCRRRFGADRFRHSLRQGDGGPRRIPAVGSTRSHSGRTRRGPAFRRLGGGITCAAKAAAPILSRGQMPAASGLSLRGNAYHHLAPKRSRKAGTESMTSFAKVGLFSLRYERSAAPIFLICCMVRFVSST